MPEVLIERRTRHLGDELVINEQGKLIEKQDNYIGENITPKRKKIPISINFTAVSRNEK